MIEPTKLLLCRKLEMCERVVPRVIDSTLSELMMVGDDDLG
jgi:hypothetical protein